MTYSHQTQKRQESGYAKPYRPKLNRFAAQISGAMRQEDYPTPRIHHPTTVADLVDSNNLRLARFRELIEKGF